MLKNLISSLSKLNTYSKVCVVFSLLFIWMHFYQLGTKPLHHDEGVNGNFMRNLIVNGNYKYDPANYHGPSLYYFQAIPTYIYAFFRAGPLKNPTPLLDRDRHNYCMSPYRLDYIFPGI